MEHTADPLDQFIIALLNEAFANLRLTHAFNGSQTLRRTKHEHVRRASAIIDAAHWSAYINTSAKSRARIAEARAFVAQCEAWSLANWLNYDRHATNEQAPAACATGT